MKKIENSKLRLSAQRALLFNIPLSVRLIFVELNSKNILQMLVYSDQDLSEEERDLLYSAAGEIEGDFVEIEDSDVEIIISKKSYEDIKKLESLVFARAE